MTVIIVDDEPLAVQLLEAYVKRIPDLKLLGSYTDSIAAMEFLQQSAPDLVLLDIQMPDMSGMEVAEILSRQKDASGNIQTRVIFTTAFKEYAFESYGVQALDFLLKPIRYPKFVEAIDKARQWFEMRKAEQAQKNVDRQSMFLNIDGQLQQIAFDCIIYVAAMKDYVMIYVDGQKNPLITHMTMNAMEEMLPAQKFMRIHRSYIVSVDRIRSIDRNNCVYIGDQIIRVTETYIDRFNEFLNLGKK